MVKLKLLAFAFFLSFQSCYVLFDQAILPVPEDITNKGLRLDGYYYTIESTINNKSSFIINNVIIPYTNGIYTGGIHCGVGENYNEITNLLKSADKGIKDNYINLDNSRHWNNITLTSDSIFLMEIGGRFGDCIKTYVGKVINDTTFTITYGSSTRCAGDSYEERQPDTLNLLFHFRKFGPKPDSSAYTNYLLKANSKK